MRERCITVVGSLVFLVIPTGSDRLVLAFFLGRGTGSLQFVLSGKIVALFVFVALFFILGKIVLIQLLFLFFIALAVFIAVLFSIGSCGRGCLLLLLRRCFITRSVSTSSGVDDHQREGYWPC